VEVELAAAHALIGEHDGVIGNFVSVHAHVAICVPVTTQTSAGRFEIALSNKEVRVS
jgi:hypothetical protein